MMIALLGPLALWAGVFLAARQSLFTMKSMLNVLSVWHGILVIVGGVLAIGFSGQSLSRYGWGALMFGFGLIWPEQWLKRQISPSPASQSSSASISR